MQGVAPIYQQTFVDTYSKVAAARLYTEKTTIAAADLLNDRVLPLFDEHDIPLVRILTDRGTEYCGLHDRHRMNSICSERHRPHAHQGATPSDQRHLRAIPEERAA